MEGPKKYFITGRLSHFVDRQARLQLEDGQSLDWPIKNLPDDIKEGDNLRLVLSTKATEEEERGKLAREILSQMLKTK